ncbi:MAG TPA: phospholipid scramblase-related protein [Bacteroidales bacterium]|nr:phospholipid scramblase-related protein [Bacteroidales bacterium]HQI46575.1 phospholipid scramblase-related protein [Bacteroidales bacterium]
MYSTFFDTNTYFIDENVNYFKFENCYKIFNEKGENIGTINQKLTSGQKVLRLFMNKANLPFLFEIRNSNNEIEASISRGWTFFLSKIIIKDAIGNKIGSVQQKFKIIKPGFKIFNNMGMIIAEISGDWKAWNFVITDNSNVPIGSISKKWVGIAKEFFTTADKYNVSIDPNYSNKENKIIILSSAITIDMVLKESK